ncbi:hypothetical protein HYS93_03420 [Candidatus Daviesbacteria bacterium]|nr:hypothetical protein [Candidatus Daviesbacteria bacterium]
MVTDNPILSIINLTNFWEIFKIGFIIFSILYFIFSLVIIRQVSLMAETVMTEGGPILRALSIFHAGLALGLIILLIGLL